MSVPEQHSLPPRRVVVLAQDLIWAERLARAVLAAGAEPARVKSVPDLDAELSSAGLAIVDLTAHAYEPIAAVHVAASAGARVLAVGPHDDLPLRKRALGAGAERVLAYRKLFEDGPTVVRRWLDVPAGADDGIRPDEAGHDQVSDAASRGDRDVLTAQR